MAMKDSPFWLFGPEHPDDVPYVMALCPCAYCREHKRFPDSAAVWNWNGFKQTLEAAQSVILADPATKQPNTFMGLPITVDESLAPGTVELRSGKDVLRIIKVTT